MKREVAWRIMAGEYNASTHRYSTGEERAPNYLVTPLGGKVNRIFLSGVLTDVENIGTDEEPMWRARVSDPTGVFYLSAGQYQPEASMALAKLKPPTFVAVIGKVRTYTTDDGTTYVSVRPEILKEVDEQTRDHWVVDACRGLKTRIEAMKEAMQMDPPRKDEIMALGYGEDLAEGMVIALEQYGEPSIEMYYGMLKDSLDYILGGSGAEAAIVDAAREETKAPPAPKADKKEAPDGPEDEEDGDENLEGSILEIIGKLDKGKDGAAWDDILDKAEEAGIDKDAVEEAVASLSDKGLIYEPVLGRVKRI